MNLLDTNSHLNAFFGPCALACWLWFSFEVPRRGEIRKIVVDTPSYLELCILITFLTWRVQLNSHRQMAHSIMSYHIHDKTLLSAFCISLTTSADRRRQLWCSYFRLLGHWANRFMRQLSWIVSCIFKRGNLKEISGPDLKKKNISNIVCWS